MGRYSPLKDARQPSPLEFALWSRIGCPRDAAGNIGREIGLVCWDLQRWLHCPGARSMAWGA